MVFMKRSYQNRLFANRRTSFSQPSLGQSVYCIAIDDIFCGWRKFSGALILSCRARTENSISPRRSRRTRRVRRKGGFKTRYKKLRALRVLRGENFFHIRLRLWRIMVPSYAGSNMLANRLEKRPCAGSKVRPMMH